MSVRGEPRAAPAMAAKVRVARWGRRCLSQEKEGGHKAEDLLEEVGPAGNGEGEGGEVTVEGGARGGAGEGGGNGVGFRGADEGLVGVGARGAEGCGHDDERQRRRQPRGRGDLEFFLKNRSRLLI